MNEKNESSQNRREFLKTTGKIAAVSALAGMTIPHVHAAGNETIQLVLIGCGGRGSGAADNALTINKGPMKLVGMVDVFEDKLETSYAALSNALPGQGGLPQEHRFIGFDGYQKAMDFVEARGHRILHGAAGVSLGAFHLRHRKGFERLHGKTAHGGRPLLQAHAEARRGAKAKNLKVGVGLMSRQFAAIAGIAQNAFRTANSAKSTLCVVTAWPPVRSPIASRKSGPAIPASAQWPGRKLP